MIDRRKEGFELMDGMRDALMAKAAELAQEAAQKLKETGMLDSDLESIEITTLLAAANKVALNHKATHGAFFCLNLRMMVNSVQEWVDSFDHRGTT